MKGNGISGQASGYVFYSPRSSLLSLDGCLGGFDFFPGMEAEIRVEREEENPDRIFEDIYLAELYQMSLEIHPLVKEISIFRSKWAVETMNSIQLKGQLPLF